MDASESVKNEWRRLRVTNPRAGGIGVDRMLGVPTPMESEIVRQDGTRIRPSELLWREQGLSPKGTEDFLTHLCASFDSKHEAN